MAGAGPCAARPANLRGNAEDEKQESDRRQDHGTAAVWVQQVAEQDAGAEVGRDDDGSGGDQLGDDLCRAVRLVELVGEAVMGPQEQGREDQQDDESA